MNEGINELLQEVIFMIRHTFFNIFQAFRKINNLVLGPLVIVIITIVLWYSLGISCLAGVGVMVLTIPVQAFVGRCFAKMRYG